MTTNVKSGDLAWWISAEQTPWPICTIGAVAAPSSRVIIQADKGIFQIIVSPLTSWWCHFPTLVTITDRGSRVQLLCRDFPIEDRRLRKICDGSMTPADFQITTDLFSEYLNELDIEEQPINNWKQT